MILCFCLFFVLLSWLSYLILCYFTFILLIKNTCFHMENHKIMNENICFQLRAQNKINNSNIHNTIFKMHMLHELKCVLNLIEDYFIDCLCFDVSSHTIHFPSTMSFIIFFQFRLLLLFLLTQMLTHPRLNDFSRVYIIHTIVKNRE